MLLFITGAMHSSWHLVFNGGVYLQVRNMYREYLWVCSASGPGWDEKGIFSAADSVRNCRFLVLPGM